MIKYVSFHLYYWYNLSTFVLNVKTHVQKLPIGRYKMVCPPLSPRTAPASSYVCGRTDTRPFIVFRVLTASGVLEAKTPQFGAPCR